MQRSTLPLLLLVLLVGAVVLYFRPIHFGDLAALAQNWDVPAWFEGNTQPPPQRTADGWVPGTPQRPTASARPASWPGNPSPDLGRQARPGAVPREPEDAPPPARQAEYPDTGYAPYEGSWNGEGQWDGPPARQGVGRIGNPPDDVWSDPFGDRPQRSVPNAPAGRPRAPGYGPLQSPRDSQPPSHGPPAPAPPAADSSAVPCPGVEILARVGSDVVFAREVSIGIADLREKNKHVSASVLEQNIREILKKRVEKRVEEKLICLHAQRTVPKDKFAKIMDHYSKVFDKYQVPEMMKRMNLGSQRELEEALRRAGVSLEIYKRGFIEEVLAQELLKTEVKTDEDVAYDELLTYYREHAADFAEHPPRARWEQLTVRTSRFPSREAAYAALAEMGNQVLDGAPLAEVAKARSHGVTAAQGGVWAWTGKDSLRSKVLDEAIFTLPIGRLSEILEDDQEFHIVRVIGREPAAMKPFADAQAEIKKKIRSQRQSDAKAAFIAKLRQQTPVSTAFDNDRTPQSARIDAMFQ